jgi:hypothetical protein
MGRTIKERVTIGKGGRIEISLPDLPEGASAEVTVVVDAPAANGEGTQNAPPLSIPLDPRKRQFKLPEEADAYLEQLRKEWDTDEERRRPISYYFGKAKGAFKDADEVDAFIRAERDAWED